MAATTVKEGYPEKLSAALVGSCTNSSYEDIGRAVDIARQAKAKGLKMKTTLWISPGSDQIYETIRATVCSTCWSRWARWC